MKGDHYLRTSKIVGNPPMKAVAIKKGQLREEPPMAEPREMGILRCDGCGEEFIIFHAARFADKAVAERQAHWLDKVLADEHERERKHPDRIQLPNSSFSGFSQKTNKKDRTEVHRGVYVRYIL
jgi:hypothetical protein